MFTRILTAEERLVIRKYLAKDGAKEDAIRKIAYRARRFMPQIDADLALMRKLLERYAEAA